MTYSVLSLDNHGLSFIPIILENGCVATGYFGYGFDDRTGLYDRAAIFSLPQYSPYHDNCCFGALRELLKHSRTHKKGVDVSSLQESSKNWWLSWVV